MASPLPVAEAWERAGKIQGWFGGDEAAMLYRLIDGPWCEIGCWKGRSTVMFACSHFVGYAIDHFKGSPEHPEGTDTFQEFLDNVKPYQNVAVLAMKFERAASLIPPSLSLLFLDADHSFEETKRAFDLYAPKVVPGGHVAFHDAKGDGWPEVERFVETLPADEWEPAGAVELTRVFRRL
jgi:hypothetical protein